ncbi:MAG: hypothetical protein Q7T33_12535 [Dehalococcoidia bacterium]|nr:hypothetical protein [Dehalococcoidia bacterium]
MSKWQTYASMLTVQHLRPQVEKRLLGAKFVRVGPLITVGAFLFETGAILGHAFRDRLDVFAEPFGSEPGKGANVCAFMRKEGRALGDLAKTANTLHALVMMHEMRTADPTRPPSQWMEWFLASSTERAPLDFALAMGVVHGCRGAGFAAEFPNRLEELYKNSYSNQNPHAWREAFKYGVVDTSEPPKFIPFEEREQEAVAQFTEFCKEFHPGFLEPLGLR